MTATITRHMAALAPARDAALTSTLKSIQAKVNEQGEIAYTMTSRSTALGGETRDQFTVETSNATFSSASCSLTVDARMTMNGTTQSQGRATIQLRDIARLAVKTQTQVIQERTMRMGMKSWAGNITPESYVIQAFRSGSLVGMLFFRDRDQAEAVAKAMSNATEACSGKKPLTF